MESSCREDCNYVQRGLRDVLKRPGSIGDRGELTGEVFGIFFATGAQEGRKFESNQINMAAPTGTSATFKSDPG